MKTAISVPEGIFKEADRLARELGISRSELYANAVKEFLEARRNQRVQEKLNEVYAREDSRLDPRLHRMQSSSMRAKDW